MLGHLRRGEVELARCGILTRYSLPEALEKDLDEVLERAAGRPVRVAPSGCFAGGAGTREKTRRCAHGAALRRAIREVWASAILDDPEEAATVECRRGCGFRGLRPAVTAHEKTCRFVEPASGGPGGEIYAAPSRCAF